MYYGVKINFMRIFATSYNNINMVDKRIIEILVSAKFFYTKKKF